MLNAHSLIRCKPITLVIALVILAATAVAQGKFRVLHTFAATGDGHGAWGQLLEDKSGNLYGTTVAGGTYNYGTVFEVSPSGSSWTETVLYSFAGSSEDYEGPQGGLVMDSTGNLYGATFYGGTANTGTIFELSPPATGGAWTETTLFDFQAKGGGPAGLLRVNNGALFGTTMGADYAYELKPPAVPGGNWTEGILFTFDGSDGQQPLYQGGALIADKSRNLYGTTSSGGAYGAGEVFELSPPTVSGSRWTGTVLFSFGGYPTDGVSPTGGLVIDASGNLYGTTLSGGTTGPGTVFELSPPASPGLPWTETLLHNFVGGADGSAPYAGLVMDKAGNLYGVTYTGGNGSCSFNYPGCGTVFEVSPGGGGSWTEFVLHSFDGTHDGEFPYGGLMIDGLEHLYGVTSEGGAHDYGTVFEVQP